MCLGTEAHQTDIWLKTGIMVERYPTPKVGVVTALRAARAIPPAAVDIVLRDSTPLTDVVRVLSGRLTHVLNGAEPTRTPGDWCKKCDAVCPLRVF